MMFPVLTCGVPVTRLSSRFRGLDLMALGRRILILLAVRFLGYPVFLRAILSLVPSLTIAPSPYFLTLFLILSHVALVFGSLILQFFLSLTMLMRSPPFGLLGRMSKTHPRPCCIGGIWVKRKLSP